ncbi:hypothetical protein BWR18_02610 [Tateyamaria omphalii]|uniref:Uncharacterized protein n=1 Tax=Tateyamaria omphalii TaxID=299262 RepID=A0A1P8MRJ3_9RHOB|nr:hypothetical protein BWR18_02610 [Tateyamaria omphalii]
MDGIIVLGAMPRAITLARLSGMQAKDQAAGIATSKVAVVNLREVRVELSKYRPVSVPSQRVRKAPIAHSKFTRTGGDLSTSECDLKVVSVIQRTGKEMIPPTI